MEKINLLMIIDDDELNNYITTKIVGYAQLAKNVESYQSPRAALEYLFENSARVDGVAPEIIFLDISMHDMNGWEFLEEYKHLPHDYQKKIKIFILSTSIFEHDRMKAGEYDCINGYIQKPLTEPKINEIRRMMTQKNGRIWQTLKTLYNFLF
ncbi:MAG: response regulator [Cyclobacteriaceae bacterium]|nr:response regulator [Cyclobacteriaceae bacterium]